MQANQATAANYSAESTLVSYHSKFCDDKSFEMACGIPILPLKTEFQGPATKIANAEEEDIVDEALTFFRATILFKNFEIKGPADKNLIFLTVFIQKCLETIQKK